MLSPQDGQMLSSYDAQPVGRKIQESWSQRHEGLVFPITSKHEKKKENYLSINPQSYLRVFMFSCIHVL